MERMKHDYLAATFGLTGVEYTSEADGTPSCIGIWQACIHNLSTRNATILAEGHRSESLDEAIHRLEDVLSYFKFIRDKQKEKKPMTKKLGPKPISRKTKRLLKKSI